MAELLPTFVIVFLVAAILMGLLWLLRGMFTEGGYESQTASGRYSEEFKTVDDLPEKIAPGQLMVKCGKCGVTYSSGIVGDSETLQGHPERFVNVTTTCPFCNQQNVTSPRNMIYTVS
jgi:hypothetical protein